MRLNAIMRRRATGDVERSVTLLHIFLLASAAILVSGGSLLGLLLTRSVEGQAVADRRQSLATYVDGVLRHHVVRDGRLVVTRATSERIAEELRSDPDILSVKVWRLDGTLAWTNLGPARIGKRFELDGELREAITENRAVGRLGGLADAGEDGLEKRLGASRLIEVYVPIPAEDGRRPLGAYEVYANAARLEESIDSQKAVIWGSVAAVFVALYAAFALLVRTASRTMRRQTVNLKYRSRALLDSYRKLEESALEAIESLNATVEAKDPDTAGHSRRVQALALRIAGELDLSPRQLDAVRHGALFHDIGKIAVPDPVLGKPGKLTPEEFAHFTRHVIVGARIVERFSRLKDAVPVILHHHERWDGTGYPDGLTRGQIPIEAAIVGLADAFDAMTTDRPYARALTQQEALAEVRTGRGTQFSPAVVDAFFAALRKPSGSVLQAVAEPAALRASAG